MKPTVLDMGVLRDVAAALGVHPDWLTAVINFESAGTWDPKISNPKSSAKGLIQFMNATAVSLGYRDSADLVAQNPTIQAQLKGPVLRYLKQFAPFHGEQDFYFSVFLPRYRRATLDTLIYAENDKRRAEFQAANPGIKTVGDYFTKLRAAFARDRGTWPGPAVAVALLAAVYGTVFFLARRGG